ncbi:MAG: HYR domain-containing protein [Acidobacteria bacterium]|nr:HYR domain-containing protein [Acidobacteriota bacterium]
MASAVTANPDEAQLDPTQPQIGPGIQQVGSNAPRSAAGSTKAGSVLFFHKFISDTGRPNQVNTLLTLTNTNPRDTVSVRVFFVSDCVVADRFVTLVANQSHTLLASREVPGKTGYAIAMAVNSQGLPTQFNWLIGSANLRDEWAHEASHNAFAIAKRSAGPLVLNASGRAAEMLFNGADYDRLPKLAAVDHLQNQDPVYQPALVTDVAVFSPLPDLSGLTPNAFKLIATAYDSNGQAFPQETRVSCGINASVGQIFSAPPFNSIIVPDRPGWATFAASGESSALPILGLSLTDGTSARLHNARVMQTLEWLDSFSMTVPVKLPDNPVPDPVTQNLPDATGGALGASEAKAGSILIFPRFASGESGNTQLFLTNTHPAQKVRLRVFFSGLAEPAAVKESIVSLSALQTMVLNPDALAPNQRGWIMVMAIDNRALPIQFNYLIGSAQVNETSGQRASFNALAIAKNSEGPVARNSDLESADLLFNDADYDRLPVLTAMTFVPSQIDNSTLLGFSRIASSLLEPPNTRTAATATLYDHLLASFTANVPRSEISLNQIRPSLAQPPITGTLQSGNHGWLKLITNNPVTSWSLNLAVEPFSVDGGGSWRGGFSGDGNLHILTTAENHLMKVPANNPNNRPPVAVAETIGFQVEARRSNGTIVRLDGSASSDEDPDDTLTFEWSDIGQTISRARVADRLLGTGAHNISLVVTDVSGISSAPVEQSVTVIDTTPPQISGVPSAINKLTDSLSGEPISFALPIAYDMVDGSMTATASKDPGSLFPLGKTVVTFSAQDKAGNRSTATMEVTLTFGAPQSQVGGVVGDKAPFMDNLNDQFVKAGEIRNVTLQASDADGDAVIFTLQNAPSYARLIGGDPGTRSATLRIAPQRGEVEGKAGVRIIINDGRGQTFTTLPFRIMISDVPNDDTGSGFGVNKPPIAVIGNLPATIQATGKTGVDLTLDANGSTDPDGDKLSFTWFDGDTLIARGAVVQVNLAVGVHSIRVVVFDGKDGLTNAGPVKITVLPRNLTVMTASPNRLNRPSTETLTITGTGFNPASVVNFGKEGISITNYDLIEEDKIVITISVSSNATPGFRDIFVINPNSKSARLRSALFVNP